MAKSVKYTISGIDDLQAIARTYRTFPQAQTSHEDIIRRAYPTDISETLIARANSQTLTEEDRKHAQQTLYRRAQKEWNASHNIDEVGLQTLLDFADERNWELIGGLWLWAARDKSDTHTVAYRVATGPKSNIQVYTGPTEDRTLKGRQKSFPEWTHKKWVSDELARIERAHNINIRFVD